MHFDGICFVGTRWRKLFLQTAATSAAYFPAVTLNIWNYECIRLHRMYSRVCYNERSYNERMLQLSLFTNKIRMLQRTGRNTIGRRRTRVRMTCRVFPPWLERQYLSFLSFVRFSYQFSSVICLFTPLPLKIYFLIILLYNFSHEAAK
jgi:hypothetical protein